MSRRRRGGGGGGGLWLLALAVLAVFVAGETLLFARSDSGKLFLARHNVVLSRPEITQTLSRSVRQTLRRLGVPSGAQQVRATGASKGPRVRWEVSLPPRASLLQVNAALARAFEQRGGRVFDAWEEAGAGQAGTVTMHLGIGSLVTHEVVLARRAEGSETEIVRVALIFEGFAREDADSLARVALDLPFEFTGAVQTNGSHPRRWADLLAEANREIVMHLPMEPLNYPVRSPGRDAILVDMSQGRIKRLVRKHLADARRPVACLAYMGGMALQDASVVETLMRELRDDGVAYLEVQGQGPSLGLETAARENVRFLRVDGRIDPGRTSGRAAERTVRERLHEIADTARRRGFASCTARLDADTIEALRREIPLLEKQGVRFVPLSSLLRPSVL